MNKPTEPFFDKFTGFVRKHYEQQLESEVILSAADHLKLLHVWRKPNSKFLEDLEDLNGEEVFVRLVPDFHVFGWCKDVGENETELKLVLTTYGGKVVLQECYMVNDDTIFDILFHAPSFLMNKLVDQSLQTCQGTVFEPKVLQKYLKDRSYRTLLIEQVGNIKTVRSRNCHYALFGDTVICQACSDLRDNVQGLTEQPKKRRKVEDEEDEDLFVKEEDDDDYYPDVKEEMEDLPEIKMETSEMVEMLEMNKDLKQCPKCLKKYAFAKSVRKHVLKCDGVYRERKKCKPPESKEVQTEEELEKEKTRRICPICLMQHKRSTTLKQHMKLHKEKIDVEALVPCPVCAENVKKVQLNDHFQQCHADRGAGVCCECMKITGERITLKYHFVRYHKYDNNTVLCTECGRGFKFQHELKVHFAEHHDQGGSSTVVCDQCGKTFFHRKRLVAHIRSAHTKSQKFECNLCEKVFNQGYKLQKHIQIHSGAKPWRCRHCAYRSVRKDNVLLHCRKVHHLQDANSARDVVKVSDEVL